MIAGIFLYIRKQDVAGLVDSLVKPLLAPEPPYEPKDVADVFEYDYPLRSQEIDAAIKSRLEGWRKAAEERGDSDALAKMAALDTWYIPF